MATPQAELWLPSGVITAWRKSLPASVTILDGLFSAQPFALLRIHATNSSNEALVALDREWCRDHRILLDLGQVVWSVVVDRPVAVDGLR